MISHIPKPTRELLDMGFRRTFEPVPMPQDAARSNEEASICRSVEAALNQICGCEEVDAAARSFLVRPTTVGRFVTIAIRPDGVFVKSGRNVNTRLTDLGYKYEPIKLLRGPDPKT